MRSQVQISDGLGEEPHLPIEASPILTGYLSHLWI